MPKVIGPLFSLLAEGNLGNVLNYHTRLQRNIVSHKIDPRPFLSSSLEEIQDFMKHTVWTWQHLTQNLKDEWDSWAHTYRPDGSGYNSFTSYYMKDLILDQIPDMDPPT